MKITKRFIINIVLILGAVVLGVCVFMVVGILTKNVSIPSIDRFVVESDVPGYALMIASTTELVPVGTPDSKWNGIPIMPDAIAGEGDTGGYTFMVQATPEEIQAYYERELAGLGYNLFVAGQGDTGSLMLIFMKGAETISVSVFSYEDLYVVLIVK